MLCIPAELVNTTMYMMRQSTTITNNTTTIPPGISHLEKAARYNELLHYIESFIYSKVIVGICMLGVVGNILNLVVLSRPRFMKCTSSLNRLERSSHTGFVAIAVSDLCCCLCLIPHAWMPRQQFYYESINFSLLYTLYGGGLVNTFIMASTWFTVMTACARYTLICRPFARHWIGVRARWSTLIVIAAISVATNVPRFWRKKITSMDCVGGHVVYYIQPSYMHNCLAYQISYFIIAIVTPLAVMVFCNTRLISTLRSSIRRRAEPAGTDDAYSSSTPIYRLSARQTGTGITSTIRGKVSGHSTKKNTIIITLTLVIIICLYAVLVVPAEFIHFIQETVHRNVQRGYRYNVAVAVVNMFQAINFSFNFILYYSINGLFRRTFMGMFCNPCFDCQCRRQKTVEYDNVAKRFDFQQQISNLN